MEVCTFLRPCGKIPVRSHSFLIELWNVILLTLIYQVKCQTWPIICLHNSFLHAAEGTQNNNSLTFAQLADSICQSSSLVLSLSLIVTTYVCCTGVLQTNQKLEWKVSDMFTQTLCTEAISSTNFFTTKAVVLFLCRFLFKSDSCLTSTGTVTKA